MRRLILIVLLLILLGGLLLGAERLDWIGAPAAETPIAGETPVTLPAGRTPGGFSLKMSPRLSQVPTRTAPAPASTPATPSFWQRLDLRWFALVLGASLLGMAFMRAWREPQPASDSESSPESDTEALTAAAVAERSEPVFERGDAVDSVNAAAMRALRERLSAIEDDLHSSEAARNELAQQLKQVETHLGETQEHAVTLQATIAERDNDLTQVNATLAERIEDIAKRDRRIADMEQTLVDADEQAQAAQGQIARLDQDGVDQRVITVEFERALLAADAQLARTQEALNARQLDNTDLTKQLHDKDLRLQSLHDDSEARIATLTQNAQRERDTLEREARARVDALTEQRDTLEASLNDARTALAERDTTLENLRRDLQLHVEQVESLGEVRDRLEAWQPTVDSLRADVRSKDHQTQALRDELDQATEQLIASRALADEVAPLKEKLAEQSALSRVLKDAADSMRLYKNAADTRGFQIGRLQDQLTSQTEQTRQEQAANETARADIAGLRRDLAEREDALQAAQSAGQTSADQVEQLTSELEQTAASLALAREELSEREQSLNDLNLIAEERTERIAQLEATLAEESGHLAELREQMAQQQQQRAALEQDVAHIETLSRDIGGTLEAPLDDIANETDVDLSQLHRDARLSVQRVRERLEIVQDLERALELDLEDSNTCLRKTESESIRVNDALNALLPKLKTATRERDDALARAQELEGQAARMDEALNDRTQLEARCETLQTELQDWQTRENDIVERIDSLAHDRSVLADNLASTRSAHDEAAARAQREQVQRVSLGHAIDQHRAHITTLKAQLADQTLTRSELADTTQQLEATRRELAAARSELEQSDQQWRGIEAHLETRLASAEEALSQSRAQYVAKAAEIDEIIRASHEQRDQLTRRLTAAQREQHDRVHRDEELAQDNLALRDTLKSVRAQTDEQIQRLRSDLERAETTAQHLNRKLETSSATQATYANAVAKLKEALAKSQSRVQMLDKAVVTLRDQREAEKSAPTPTLADRPVRVPVLRQPVTAPPVLTRAVRDDDKDS